MLSYTFGNILDLYEEPGMIMFMGRMPRNRQKSYSIISAPKLLSITNSSTPIFLPAEPLNNTYGYHTITCPAGRICKTSPQSS
jgi:hypothetical protein